MRCPLCAAPLEVVACTTVREYHPGHHVMGRALPEHEMPTTAVSCSGCEFVVDLEYGDRSARPHASLEAEMRLMMRNALDNRF